MPCWIDGELNNGQVSFIPAEHRKLIDSTTAGSAETIAINWQTTWEAQMMQLTAHWSAIPTTSEDFVLSLDAVVGSSYDTIQLAVDPATEGIQNLTCVTPFRWGFLDRLICTYPNTDDLTIGVQILLIQVDHQL